MLSKMMRIVLALTMAVPVMMAGSSAQAVTTAPRNPVVGTWYFSDLNYDHRYALPTWNTGVVTLNQDLTLTAQITKNSPGGQAPAGVSKGTYSITSDGQFNAVILDQGNLSDGVKIAGRVDRSNEVIAGNMMINPQQPAMVTMVRKGRVSPAMIPGRWVMNALEFEPKNSKWLSVIFDLAASRNVVITKNDSQGKKEILKGTYTFNALEGVLTISVVVGTLGDVMTVTAQVAPSGEIASVVYGSNDLKGAIGSGTMVKQADLSGGRGLY